MSIRRIPSVTSACLLTLAALALPASAAAQMNGSIFAGVSLGMQTPADGSLSQSASTTLFGETATQKSDYNVPAGLLFAALLTEPWWTLAVVSIGYLVFMPFAVVRYARIRRQRAGRLPAGGPLDASRLP